MLYYKELIHRFFYMLHFLLEGVIEMDILKKQNQWKKGILLFVFYLMSAAFPLCAQAEEPDEEATIYGLGSAHQEKISIPDNLPQSYQITTGGETNATYSIASGSSAKVSSDGIVTPKYTYWKRYSGYSSSVPEGEDYDYYTINSGDTTITAKAAGKTYTVTVHVQDYSIAYGDQVMDTYLKENINDAMTDYEIMQAIAKFPASFDYSGSYSGVYSMIIYGGGDCWASTSAIITLCEKLGIKAWSRNGNKDLGAGSGHMNAMAELNGNYYELEAGYSMGKTDGYRPYSVTPRSSLFSCRSYSDGLSIYQYDGYDTTGTLEIPETINGKPVTMLSQSALSGTKFSEIKLPDTLAGIGDFAFSGCENLTKITIPASVTSIGDSVFASCKNLANISVAEGNASYKEENQVIYSMDGSVLVACPAASQVSIPSTVTKIADYAFYYNENLKNIVIPESVAEMGEGAFGNCSQLSAVTIEGNGLTTIGTHCFRSDSAISVIKIPSSVTSIGAYSFAYCSGLKQIYFLGDAPEFGETIDGAFYDQVFYGCNANGYYIEDNGTWTEELLSGHGGTIAWAAWNGTPTISIKDAIFNLEQENYAYTGKKITPAVTITLDNMPLVENKDYILDYSNNIDAGTATVTAIGIGSYDGEVSSSFTVGKAKRTISAYIGADTVSETDTTYLTDLYYSSDKLPYTYTSSDPSIATVDSDGVVTGISAGTATLTVSTAETKNYLAAEATVDITVTHVSNPVIIDDTVTDGCIQVKCSQCGKIYQATVPTDYYIYWSLNGVPYYGYTDKSTYKPGDVLECICLDASEADLGDMEIISHDNGIVTVTENKYLNFIADGTAKVEIRPKYNPSIGKLFTFYVGDSAINEGDNKNDNATDNSNKNDNAADNGNNGKNDNAADNGNSDKNDNAADNGNSNKDDNAADNKNNNPVQNDADTGKYYDESTGITILANKKDTKNATLLSVDKTHAVGNLNIPNTIKANGTVYTITGIGKNAFKNNKQLKTVVMGKYIQTVDDGAFSGCDRLQAVTVGKNVAKIGDKAFYQCKKLKKITIPPKVQKIGKSAFYGCKNLKQITIQSKKLTNKNVGSKAFKNTAAKPTIKVPKSKLAAYRKLLKAKGISSKAKIKK